MGKVCSNCNLKIDNIENYCGVECMFEHKIKIKKEHLPKERAGVKNTKVFKDKKKYSRKVKYARKISN